MRPVPPWLLWLSPRWHGSPLSSDKCQGQVPCFSFLLPSRQLHPATVFFLPSPYSFRGCPSARWLHPQRPALLPPHPRGSPPVAPRTLPKAGGSPPGSPAPPPAATFSPLLIIRCPPRHPLSILPAEQNISAAYGERLCMADRPGNVIACLINRCLKVTFSIPVGLGTRGG